MQLRPFKERIEKGHQRDANLCGAYARPTDERSLVRGGEGYNQGSFVYFSKACGGWGTHVMRTLHEANAKPSVNICENKNCVGRCGFGGLDGGSTEGGGSEVLLCARVLCCVGARPGMRSWQSMVQVAANTKTSRVGVIAHQS